MELGKDPFQLMIEIDRLGQPVWEHKNMKVNIFM